MKKDVLWEGNTPFGRYEIVDTIYDGRPARVLYSGDRHAAQSGVAHDDEPDLLFDYNQRMLELAQNLTPASVLIIGGGVGTLATALLWALPDVRVDIVEPDEALGKLSYEYFGLPRDDRLRQFHTDGRTYLRSTSDRYDMICIDAFMHTTIPAELQTLESFQAACKHLNDTGLLAMNIISGYYGPSGRTLRQLYAASLRSFDSVDILLAGHGYSLWLPQNFVLTAQKGTDYPVKDYVRTDVVKPPEIHPNEVLHDD